MSILSTIGPGMFLIGLLLVACIRWRGRSSQAASRRRIPLDQLPDSQSLSGIPLRILLSERVCPGPLLRDMLQVRPDAGDYPRPRRGSRRSHEGESFAASASSVAMWSAAPYR